MKFKMNIKTECRWSKSNLNESYQRLVKLQIANASRLELVPNVVFKFFFIVYYNIIIVKCIEKYN